MTLSATRRRTGSLLLGHVDHAEAAFADLLEKLVAADVAPGASASSAAPGHPAQGGHPQASSNPAPGLAGRETRPVHVTRDIPPRARRSSAFPPHASARYAVRSAGDVRAGDFAEDRFLGCMSVSVIARPPGQRANGRAKGVTGFAELSFGGQFLVRAMPGRTPNSRSAVASDICSARDFPQGQAPEISQVDQLGLGRIVRREAQGLVEPRQDFARIGQGPGLVVQRLDPMVAAPFPCPATAGPSTRIRRIASAAAAKKCPRPFHAAAPAAPTSLPTNRRYASCTSAVAWSL